MADTMKALVSEGNFAEIICDPSTHGLITVDEAHSHLQEGKAFTVALSSPDMGALTTPDDTLHLHFTVPDVAERMHLVWHVHCSAAAQFLATINPTGGLSTPEGSIVPRNHRMESTNVSNLSFVYYNASAPTGGTVVRNEYFGQRTAGGERRGESEVVLKPTDVISVQLISSTAGASGTIQLHWYEHAPKETIL
jgi:hypothetical protein